MCKTFNDFVLFIFKNGEIYSECTRLKNKIENNTNVKELFIKVNKLKLTRKQRIDSSIFFTFYLN